MKVQHKLWAWLGAVSVLLAVFTMYTRPEFLLTLGNQIWSCF